MPVRLFITIFRHLAQDERTDNTAVFPGGIGSAFQYGVFGRIPGRINPTLPFGIVDMGCKVIIYFIIKPGKRINIAFLGFFNYYIHHICYPL